MAEIIKWGIIGPGLIAQKFAADLQRSANGELYGVASRDIQKAKYFAEKYFAEKVFDSYESLAMDPDVDVIYVATPHTFHFEHAMMCLQHGKSVLCEKPLGVNLHQVQQMIHEARKQKLFLMEGLWTRFIPATEKVLSVLNSKDIGEITGISADFGFNAAYDTNHRLFNKSLGGGSLLDIGIYPLYISLLLLGIPSGIDATAQMTNTGVDSSCEMTLIYKDAIKAKLKSTIKEDTPTQAVICCEKGTIILHKPFHHAEKVTVVSNGIKEDFELPYRGHGYLYEIEEVNKCIDSGKTESVILPLQTSIDLHTIIDRVLRRIELVY